MRLSDLTGKIAGHDNPEIKGITQDSRAVQPGWLFVALPGAKADGRSYIAEAVAKGAVAVLAAPGTTAEGAVVLHDENPRAALSRIAAQFYKRQPEVVAAVTGTNGKTSTATFTQQIWHTLGYKSASLGTLGVRGDVPEKYGALTTPDTVSLHAELDHLAQEKVTHLAMEASSHGLHQHRLDSVKVSAAGFTNLTRDHLDYHADMESYHAAKARLFSDVLAADGTAVLNADVPEGALLEKICAGRGIRVFTYGRQGRDIRLLDRKALPGGQALKLDVLGKSYDITLPLVGAFMAMNTLCALGLVLAREEKRQDDVVRALEKLQGAPGRLQLVAGHPRGAAVYVDYAHTPDALQNVLEALRPHTEGRLMCLAGCGGDRDPGKRPIMGRLAAELADIAVITDDNPRTEDPVKIRAAMMAAAQGAVEIGGRREAIQWAVSQLQKGDVLVLAGKGHEQGQIIGTRVEPFDDVDEAQKAIQLCSKETA